MHYLLSFRIGNTAKAGENKYDLINLSHKINSSLTLDGLKILPRSFPDAFQVRATISFRAIRAITPIRAIRKVKAIRKIKKNPGLSGLSRQ